MDIEINLTKYKFIKIEKNNVKKDISDDIFSCYINDDTKVAKVYFKSNIKKCFPHNPTLYEIHERTLQERLINYFKEISKYMKSDDNGQYKTSFLQREYDKINDFNEKKISEDSIAFLYAQGKPDDLLNHSEVNNSYIYPFKTNYSQYKAIKNAFSHKISVIEGPPGTGKTQTILNLVANIVIQGQTVAIVSNNNSAFENVYKKLSDEKYNFFVPNLVIKKHSYNKIIVKITYILIWTIKINSNLLIINKHLG